MDPYMDNTESTRDNGRGRPIGAHVGITYDTESMIYPGDVVQSISSKTGKGLSCYRVLESRLQERGNYAGVRWHLRCVKIAADDIEHDDVVHPLYWYAR